MILFINIAFFFLSFFLLSSDSWVSVGSQAAQALRHKVFPSALWSGCVAGEEQGADYLCVHAGVVWVGNLGENTG